MKIVVIGGSGLIGKKLIPLLRGAGHEAVSASPSSGVNTLTGEGLSEALAGADVVVDVTNSPSFEDKAVLEFFETSTRNILSAEAAAGVKHHVALSVVGADSFPDSGYMRAKVSQEKLIQASGVPYTILRATQFFEFLGPIAGSGADTASWPRSRSRGISFFPMRPLPPITTIFMPGLLSCSPTQGALFDFHHRIDGHSFFFSGMTMSLASSGCRTTAMKRALFVLLGFLLTPCRQPVGS